MLVKYTYRCPKCGKVTKQELEQEIVPFVTNIVKVCDKCRSE